MTCAYVYISRQRAIAAKIWRKEPEEIVGVLRVFHRHHRTRFVGGDATSLVSLARLRSRSMVTRLMIEFSGKKKTFQWSGKSMILYQVIIILFKISLKKVN